MVALLALILGSTLGQIHTEEIKVELPHMPKSVVVEIKGEVSNAADPCLTIPIRFTVLTQEYGQYAVLKKDCKIRYEANWTGKGLKISLQHCHNLYESYLDFIGKIEYKVFADDEVISGEHELKQTPHMEKIKPMWTEELKPATKVFSPQNSDDHQWVHRIQLPVIPYRRYRIEFEYITSEECNCSNPTFNIFSFNPATYKRTDPQSFKLVKPRKPRWSKFSEIISPDPLIQYIEYNWQLDIKTNVGEDWIGGIYIRNAVLIPLDNPKVKNGP